jgi:ribulose-5-phosphate 4-epimerase/fuculose-1-phosphate aldolase
VTTLRLHEADAARRRPAGPAAVEGVTKFAAAHEARALPVNDPVIDELLAWRSILFDLAMIGRDPARYEGAGFGNASARVGPSVAPRGKRAFVVTGTQTGGTRDLARDGLVVVKAYDARANTVVSVGPVDPSSESLTHGAVYDAEPSARVVLHAHAPEIFRARDALGLPSTAAHVEYGTPEMAWEVERLMRGTSLRAGRVFAMAGHEDGIVGFGATASAAGAALLTALARARALTASRAR